MSDDEANAIVDNAYANNWQILIHANGDAAIDQMLAAVTAATDAHGGGDRRSTLIHGQYIRADQLDQMVELEINEIIVLETIKDGKVVWR